MAVSFYPSAVLLGLLALTISPAIAVDTSTCTCYQTSTDDFFTSYKFYDFRSVGLPSGVPTLESTLPDSADDDTGVSADDVGVLQGGFIQSQEWMSSWGIQDWGKGQNKDTSYRMWNSLSNVYFDKNTDGNANASTKLVMRTKRFAGFQSTAEVENQYALPPPFHVVSLGWCLTVCPQRKEPALCLYPHKSSCHW